MISVRRPSFLLLGTLALAAGPAVAVTHVVTLSGVRFSPAEITIEVGDTVLWQNEGDSHTVTANDGSFDSGDPRPGPWELSFTFESPGDFSYFCEVHVYQGMTGVVHVQASQTEAPGSLRLSSSSPAIAEGGVAAVIMVERTGGDDGAVGVDYATGGGTATPDADYTPAAGFLAFGDGDDSPKNFSVPILQDSIVEGNETVGLALNNPTGGAVLGNPSAATLSIQDDDAVTGPCVAGATTLCLNGGRFRVEATFQTAEGANGVGQAQPLTDDTGYLWFFDEDNVEVVVKVLNACGIDGHYWVFAGGLTDVRVVITVTDTKTGVPKEYRNPQKTPFAPVQDTEAFATCP